MRPILAPIFAAAAFVASVLAWPSAQAWLAQAPASAPAGSVQVFSTVTPLASNAGDRFGPPFAATGGFAASDTAFMVFPVSGTVSGLRVYAVTQPTAGSWTVSLDKNGVAAISCTIDSTTDPCAPAGTTSFSVSPGDTIDFQSHPVSASASTVFSLSFDFTPAAANDTVLAAFNQAGAFATTGTAYLGAGSLMQPSAAAANRNQGIVTEAGTVDKLYVVSTDPATAGSSYTYGAAAAGTAIGTPANFAVAIAAGCGTNCPGHDTTDTAAIAAGQYLAFTGTASATAPVGATAAFGLRYVPATAKDFLLLTSDAGQGDNSTGTDFFPITNGVQVPAATEANAQSIANAMTLTELDVTLSGTTAGTKTFAVNACTPSGGGGCTGVATAASCSITGAATHCVWTGSAAIAAGSLIDLADTSIGTTTGGLDVSATLIAHR